MKTFKANPFGLAFCLQKISSIKPQAEYMYCLV
jgi:hypothetical protein